MNVLAHTSHIGTTGYNAHSQGFFRKLSEKVNLKIRNFTVGKNWKGYPCTDYDYHGIDASDLDKNLLHLQTLWDINNQRKDFPIYNYDSNFEPDINIILNTVDHYYFYDSYKGYKIAYNVWENSLYPENFFEKLKEFDQVWVASKWQRQMLIEQGMFENKIKVVPEAVDSTVYYPKDINYDDNKFRFLVFGAWCDRKSTKEIIKCFIDVFGKNENVELVLSTESGFYNDGCSNTNERLKKYNLIAPNIKVLNFPDRKDYIEYLQKGHVFLSCARGEGWNIPLLEAMACGTPSIYSECSGQLEFAEGKGISVKIKNRVLAQDFLQNKNQISPGYWYEPDFDDLKNKMLDVYKNYSFYKQKALDEAKDIAKTFTWENAASLAFDYLKDLDKNKLKVLTSCSFVGNGGFNAVCQNLLLELNNICDVKVRNYTIFNNWKSYNLTPHDLDIEENHKKILHSQTLYNQDGSRTDYPIYNYQANYQPDINLVINESYHHYFYDDYKGPKIAYSMYETTEFPNDFLDQIKKFNQFWVPSEWQKNCLIEQGFPSDKIRIVPLGVDENVFNTKKKKLKNKFTFAIFGRWDQRKSTIDLIRCFNNLFKNNENVELLLSVDNPYDIDGLKNTQNRLKHYNLESKNIRILNFLTKQDYVDCLKSIHVFLSCSKGEGWNLPLIEAMACGVPSIYSECSGQLEFAKNLGIPIKIKSQEKANKFISEQFCKSIQGDYYIPDFDDLKNKMIEIYENYDKFLKKSINESSIIIKNFSWINSAKIAFNNIMELQKTLSSASISFVGFTHNNLGIRYTNNSIFNVDAKIKFLNADDNSILFEDKITCEYGCEYFSALAELKSSVNEVLFNVYDSNDNLQFSVSKKFNNHSNSILKNINHKIIYCDASVDLSGLYFKYEKSKNKLFFYTTKDIRDFILIVKDLKKNLNLSYINNRQSFSIIQGWEYFTSPYLEKELDIDIFTGFKFIAYRNNKLLFDIEIPINPDCPTNKHERQFKFSTDLDLCLYDNFFSQSFDFYSKDFYKSIIKENDIVLDVGASCGTFVDFCLSKKASKIIAIEPSKSFGVLQETFKNIQQVYLENKALSFKEETVNLTTCGNSTLTSFYFDKQTEADGNDLQNIETISVPTCTIDSIFKKYKLEKIDVLKIDIEGFEYEIFKYLTDDIIKKFKSFIIEYHHNDGHLLRDCILNKLQSNDFLIEHFNLNYELTDDFNQKKGVIYAYSEKTISIVNESGSLGDNIAWVPVVDHFQKIHRCKVKYYTPYKELFEKEYSNINFYNYNEKPNTVDYSLGCFDINNKKWNEFNLQELAFKILGLEYTEIRPKISLPKNLRNNFNKKYVCIGSLSTAQAKFWNNEGGWIKLVDYLKSLGYEVVSIDKHNNIGYGQYVNSIPYNSLDKTGDISLEERINDLYFCDFFIGLGSGLSWLAWAIGKPVVMISGFSDPKSEFYTPYRVHNKNICNSCWNDPEILFDKGNWSWCPRNKNFECTKEITFEMVKEKIDLLLSDLKNPKILLAHLISDKNGNKEKLSIENIINGFSLMPYVNYCIKNSKIYDAFPENLKVFENNTHWIKIDKKSDEFGLTPRHYGCYKAHTDAILDFFENENDYDYLVVSEGDSKILTDSKSFKTFFEKAIQILEKTNYKLFTFGRSVDEIKSENKIIDDIYSIENIWGAHLYIIPKKHKYFYKYIFNKYDFHAFDWWLNYCFEREGEKFLRFNTDKICFEFEGYSYIDKTEKKYS